MAVLQPIFKTGPRGTNQARRLMASATQPAMPTIAATIECSDYADTITVVPCTSKINQEKCGVVLIPGQRYYMVRSPKFTTRWYVLTQNATGAWICSLRDMCDRCVAQVERFLHQPETLAVPVPQITIKPCQALKPPVTFRSKFAGTSGE